MISANIFIVISVFLLGAVAIFWGLHRQKQQQQFRSREGLECLLFLKTCLMLIQQHRGTTTGYLSGDASLKANIEQIEQQLNTHLKQAEHRSALSNDGRWIGINDHWSRLAGGYERLGKQDNLQQHNTLVSHLLYLIEDIADHYRLVDIQEDVKGAALWKDALRVAEYIGQARAIGTGVAAAGVCDSVSRIRLLYLYDKVISSLAECGASIAGDYNDKKAIYDFTTELQRLTEEEQPSISSHSYYQMATVALNGIYTQFDQKLNELLNRI